MTLERARKLRKNQTETEKLIWSALRRNRLEGLKFKRQAPVGPYILDFVCLTAKLVLEIDGQGHDQTVAYDTRRTSILKREGFLVMRFSNEDVRENLEGVIETIRIALLERASG